MQQDPVEKRKEAKPLKLFTINAFVFDDGVVSGTCVEYRTLGRLKNQKCIVPDGDDFISCIRSLIPSAIPAVEPLVKQIFNDIGTEDTEECEKIGKVVVDIYNDGFVDCDFGELVKGQRGAPKTWRLHANDFFSTIECQVGQLTPPFKSLVDNGGRTLIEPIPDHSSAVMMDLEQEDDDEQLDENYDLTSE